MQRGVIKSVPGQRENAPSLSSSSALDAGNALVINYRMKILPSKGWKSFAVHSLSPSFALAHAQ